MAASIRHLPRSRAEVAGLDALDAPLVGPASRDPAHLVRPVAEGARAEHGLPALADRRLDRLAPRRTCCRARWTCWPVSRRTCRRRELWLAVATTFRRGIWGFAAAIVIGVGIGATVTRFRIMRAAIGSLITGLQTMPSIAWFPLAILLFKLSEEAITFVVVLGAAPSIANGLIHGIDHIPPVLRRAGRVLGATGIDEYRHVILPAAMPSFMAGVKNGWAFAWRSLMAGELIVVIANQASLGQLLQVNRELSDAQGLLAIMLVILIIGIVLDSLVFGTLDRRIRAKRGLLTA